MSRPSRSPETNSSSPLPLCELVEGWPAEVEEEGRGRNLTEVTSLPWPSRTLSTPDLVSSYNKLREHTLRSVQNLPCVRLTKGQKSSDRAERKPEPGTHSRVPERDTSSSTEEDEVGAVRGDVRAVRVPVGRRRDVGWLGRHLRGLVLKSGLVGARPQENWSSAFQTTSPALLKRTTSPEPSSTDTSQDCLALSRMVMERASRHKHGNEVCRP